MIHAKHYYMILTNNCYTMSELILHTNLVDKILHNSPLQTLALDSNLMSASDTIPTFRNLITKSIRFDLSQEISSDKQNPSDNLSSNMCPK